MQDILTHEWTPYKWMALFSFVNKRLLKNPDTNLSVLNVQLGNFRKFTKNMEREELAKYLAMFRQSLIDCFPEETIATRVSDDSYLIAVFTSNQNPEYLIEDFLLRLHWKRRIDNNKLFISPRYCTVRYPEDGRDAPVSEETPAGSSKKNL